MWCLHQILNLKPNRPSYWGPVKQQIYAQIPVDSWQLRMSNKVSDKTRYCYQGSWKSDSRGFRATERNNVSTRWRFIPICRGLTIMPSFDHYMAFIKERLSGLDATQRWNCIVLSQRDETRTSLPERNIFGIIFVMSTKKTTMHSILAWLRPLPALCHHWIGSV